MIGLQDGRDIVEKTLRLANFSDLWDLFYALYPLLLQILRQLAAHSCLAIGLRG